MTSQFKRGRWCDVTAQISQGFLSVLHEDRYKYIICDSKPASLVQNLSQLFQIKAVLNILNQILIFFSSRNGIVWNRISINGILTHAKPNLASKSEPRPHGHPPYRHLRLVRAIDVRIALVRTTRVVRTGSVHASSTSPRCRRALFLSVRTPMVQTASTDDSICNT